MMRELRYGAHTHLSQWYAYSLTAFSCARLDFEAKKLLQVATQVVFKSDNATPEACRGRVRKCCAWDSWERELRAEPRLRRVERTA
jgi:hypothetical protein